MHEELRFLVPSNVIRVIKSRKMIWTGNGTCVGKKKKCMGRCEGKRPLGRHRHGCEAVEWIHLVQK
jgi:hypothetical protein